MGYPSSMTAIVGVHVPGYGAVLASDGRLSDDDGLIHSDRAIKLARAKWGILAMAGHIQALPVLARRTSMQLAYQTPVPELEYDVIAYDGSGLYCWDHTRSVVHVHSHTSAGCGGHIALGVLEASDHVKTLDEAVQKAKAAVRAAIRRNTGCGGKVRVLKFAGR